MAEIIYFFYKTSYLNKGVNCTEPSPSVRFLGQGILILLGTWNKLPDVSSSTVNSCTLKSVMIDLLLLTSLDQQLFTLKMCFTLIQTSQIEEEINSTVLSLLL